MDTQTHSGSTPTDSTTSASAHSSVLRLTERAIAQVKEVLQAQGLEGHYLTVRVVPSGCSGFGYDLNMQKEAQANDLVWEQDGIKICTDALSSQYLTGTEMDYVSHEHGAGFKFNNPNAKASCGCGNSFST
jgi:iron-sulfur cluster assembly protein